MYNLTMTIRKALKKDAEYIVGIIRQSVEGTHKDLYSQENIQNILKNYTLERVLHFITSYDYFVVEDKKKIVGCVLAKEGKMRSLYILPSYRGKGIGRMLVEVVEKHMKEQGYKEIWLWSSLVSYDFYLHMGYEFLEDVRNDKGEVIDKAMRKSL